MSRVPAGVIALLVALVLPATDVIVDAGPGAGIVVIANGGQAPLVSGHVGADVFLADEFALRGQLTAMGGPGFTMGEVAVMSCWEPMFVDAVQPWAGFGGVAGIAGVGSTAAGAGGLVLGVGVRWFVAAPFAFHAALELPVGGLAGVDGSSAPMLIPRIGLGLSGRIDL